jgi:DNA-binding NtrC family response regulator
MALPFEGNAETILLVEHDQVLLRRIKRILVGAKFDVLPASSAREAMRVEASYPGTIDLLLCGIMVVGTSGPTLTKRIRDRRPQIRTALMAGYPGGALLVLNYGWHYLEPPNVATGLVGKMKDILRGEAQEQSADRFDTLKVPRKSFGRAMLSNHSRSMRRARQRA